MLEAQVLAIKGKHYPCRNYQVIVQDKAGKSIRIWIPKEKHFMVGKTYRFYFNKMEQIPEKTDQVNECRYEIFYGDGRNPTGRTVKKVWFESTLFLSCRHARNNLEKER